jgi:hypothetical protein
MSLGDSKLASRSQEALQTLRIIVLALAAGVTAFAGYAVYHNWGKPHTLAQKFDAQGLVFLAMGLAALPLGLVIPRLMARVTKMEAPPDVPAGLTPEQATFSAVQQRIQTRVIIACAIFEGAAFPNVFGYMQSRELLHLAVAGILVMAILAHFPLGSGAYEQAVERELQQMEDEQSLTRRS